MAETAAAAPEAQVDAPERLYAADDGIRTHPHALSGPKKSTSPPDFKKQLLRRLKQEGDTKRNKQLAEEFASKLATSRAELISKLDTPPVSDAEASIAKAFQEYAALLLGLATADLSSQQQAAELAQTLQPTRMRDAISFEWQDVLLNNQAIVSADAVFELASTVIAVSAWRSRRAAYLCKDARAGIDSAQAGQAYRLLLQAAGGFQFVRDSCAPHLASACASADCTDQAASALLHVSLADAQAITTLRAMAKNNAPSLIAGLALDTADLYKTAANAAQSAPFSKANSKVLKYGQYKTAVFQAYAYCFTGLIRLKEGQAGQAIRFLEESKRRISEALPLAAAYNKAEPSTPAADHTEFDRDLSICVDAAYARATKENEHVYYQRPPLELPALPEPRRLVNATVLTLPPVADSVKELTALDAFAAVPQPEVAPSAAPGASAAVSSAPTAGASAPATVHQAGEPKIEPQAGKEESASCWRWLLVIIAMPVLVILSVVGMVVWLVLLPVKIICCPIGCLIQIMADLVEYFLKAPFKGLLWASGKPWKAQKVPDEEAQHAAKP